ncbi:PREDICTED: uncharacterized protein LOC106148063, partial [Chinchilla lanigera]|uniref:uncharacterized protein LOC106148063 n=1 Tax=Chinchilla lanigera TaxID=34839 RepID=UPI0006978930
MSATDPEFFPTPSCLEAFLLIPADWSSTAKVCTVWRVSHLHVIHRKPQAPSLHCGQPGDGANSYRAVWVVQFCGEQQTAVPAQLLLRGAPTASVASAGGWDDECAPRTHSATSRDHSDCHRQDRDAGSNQWLEAGARGTHCAEGSPSPAKRTGTSVSSQSLRVGSARRRGTRLSLPLFGRFPRRGPGDWEQPGSPTAVHGGGGDGHLRAGSAAKENADRGPLVLRGVAEGPAPRPPELPGQHPLASRLWFGKPAGPRGASPELRSTARERRGSGPATSDPAPAAPPPP